MRARPPARPPARCLALLRQLSDYIDHELPPQQRRAIDAHCRDCTRCQRMIASLRRTVALLQRSELAPMPGPTRVRARARIARLLNRHPRSVR